MRKVTFSSLLLLCCFFSMPAFSATINIHNGADPSSLDPHKLSGDWIGKTVSLAISLKAWSQTIQVHNRYPVKPKAGPYPMMAWYTHFHCETALCGATENLLQLTTLFTRFNV